MTGDGRRRPTCAKLDAYLCELKEAQIRDGLHVFGQSPDGRLERDLVQALVRVPRGDGHGRRCLADRGRWRPISASGFDPLDCDMAARWDGPRPDAARRPPMHRGAAPATRSSGSKLLAARLIDGDERRAGADERARCWTRSRPRSAPGRARLRPGRERGPPHRPCTGASSPRRHPARRRAAGSTCCRPGATSTRSTPAPCRRRPPGRWAGNRPSLLIEKHLQDQGDWPRAHAADRLGHRQHAHRRRRHRAGAGADGREADLGRGQPPRHRLRDHPADRARPAARRRDPAHLGLLPRCLPGPDRPGRQRRARGAWRWTSPTTSNPAAAARPRGEGDSTPAPGLSAPSPAPTAPGCRR